jgi:hypothetical protein
MESFIFSNAIRHKAYGITSDVIVSSWLSLRCLALSVL